MRETVLCTCRAFRIDNADHPVLGHLAGDLPPAVGAVTAGCGFDVRPGDQRQQRDGLGGPLVKLTGRHDLAHRGRVTDQRVDQRRPRLLIVSGDLRLTDLAVVIRAAPLSHDHVSTRDLPGDRSDHRDQLRHGVLRRDRVIEHRRDQRPASCALERTGLGHDRLDRLEDPVQPRGGSKPSTPLRQDPGIETSVPDRHTAGDLPPQIGADRSHRLAVRQAVQPLQHQDRRGDVDRDRRPPAAARIQVLKQHLREQHPAMLGKQLEHAAHPDQMTSDGLGINKLTLIKRTTLQRDWSRLSSAA